MERCPRKPSSAATNSKLDMRGNFATTLLLTSAFALVAGCGDEDPAPRAVSQSLNGTEDQPLEGKLTALAIKNGTATFRVVAPPGHGRVDVDATSGAFHYVPDENYWGADSFLFVAKNARNSSRPAKVALYLQAVNDEPTLDTIPDLQNSAYERDTRYVLGADDVDGDVLYYSLSVHDSAIARALIDPATRELTIEPLSRGATQVSVEVRDAQSTVSAEFKFSVGDVTKAVVVDTAGEGDRAIALVNASDRTVAFDLSHNAFPMLGSDEQMVEYVRAMPPVIADEQFERKLWRFVRNNTYHSPPLSADQWIGDPWLVISSLGWGFCSEVSAAYVRLARAAGYEARVYGLTGHVVPEIKIGERWQMFDPDLALYYRTRDGEIAGVEDLAADPTLITEPTEPVLDTEVNPFPYSELIASIYASAADNYVGDAVFLIAAPAPRPPLTLLPGAEFIYPGRWTETPIGYDGDTPYEVPAFVQGSLTTPSAWTGPVPLPWRLIAVQGEGRVRLAEQEFELGSPELADALRANPLEYDHVQIVEARSPVRLVMFMNTLRYELRPSNQLELHGQDVWAINVGSTKLQPELVISGSASIYSKPRPVQP